jgi:anti-sigma factor RsiW
VTPCREYDALLSLRAAEALDPEEAARLEAHLPGCAACRAGLEAYAGALALARLPPVSDAERAAAAALAASVIAEDGRRARRRRIGGRLLVSLSAVAAAAAVAFLPSWSRIARAPAEQTTLVAAAGWQEPDLDEIWETTEVLEWSE